MKRICFISNHLQPSDGVARVAIGISNILAQREDVEVTLLFLYKYDTSMLGEISDKVKLAKGFGFYFRGFARIVNMIPKGMLYRFLFREEYDIEVSFGCPVQIVAASKNARAKHLAWVHGHDDRILSAKSAYQKCDRVICVSKAIAEWLEEEFGAIGNIDYCYSPIDDKKIQAMGAEAIDITPHPEMQFVTVGRLSPEKGYLRLLNCVKRLKMDGYSFQLWMIGDGPQSRELREQVCKENLSDCVYFSGEVDNPHKYTSKADVFLCSSFTEGYSTACTEALILGVPVLTTDVSGGKELIDTAEAGCVVGLDTESLYQGMKEILDHPKSVQVWKETLRSTRERFSYEERSQRLFQVLGLE